MMLGRQRGQILGISLLVSLLGTVESFGIVVVQKHATTTCLYEKKEKVTEEDVIVAVEKAETLWEQALTARETAEELSALAENFGNDAASSAKEAEEDLQALMKESGKFGLGQIANAQIAMNTSFDAGTALTDAFDATEEADRLEQLAEEALKESEEALAQHLIDFPENNE